MKKLISILVFGLLSACSTNAPNTFSRVTDSTYKSYSDFVERQQLNLIDKVDDMAFWDVRALDNDYAVLSVKRNKHYLLALDDSCKGMEFDARFGLVQQEEHKLNVKDKILKLTNKNSSCSITSIYKLYQVQFEELERLRAQTRNSSRDLSRSSGVRVI
ncbi:DUF6491 family protein [Neptunicella marina]|uniref:Lipoprotein n=1 Tax=Neptunicella marina TaxID=2125989 RepID=A0A8J6M4F2_9ALTE|nr:DUF6491 family protein [Neptunicella marina]MBC3767872.1 hypothetical protein [Neptunicella marina]